MALIGESAGATEARLGEGVPGLVMTRGLLGLDAIPTVHAVDESLGAQAQ